MNNMLLPEDVLPLSWRVVQPRGYPITFLSSSLTLVIAPLLQQDRSTPKRLTPLPPPPPPATPISVVCAHPTPGLSGDISQQLPCARDQDGRRRGGVPRSFCGHLGRDECGAVLLRVVRVLVRRSTARCYQQLLRQRRHSTTRATIEVPHFFSFPEIFLTFLELNETLSQKKLVRKEPYS